MADYWKSQPRKFCDFCKCWIADNKPSRDFHEKGKRHQESVANKLSELRKKGLEDAKKEKDTAGWMVQMEREALKKLKEDLTSDPSLAKLYGVKIKNETAAEETLSAVVKKEAKDTKDSTDNTGVWQEACSQEGYVYYWNSSTGESRWELPSSADSTLGGKDEGEGKSDDVRLTEDRKSDLMGATNQVDDSAKKVRGEDDGVTEPQETAVNVGDWQQLVSPEGYPYFWNKQTGEVSWEAPCGEASAHIKTEAEESTTAVQDSSEPQDAKVTVKLEKVEEDADTGKTPSKLPANQDVGTADQLQVAAEHKRLREPSTTRHDGEPPGKRLCRSAYGEWQEVKQESEPQVDLELPCDLNREEVKTITLSEEPKVKFKEKKVASLGGMGSSVVTFKKRKINSGAAKGNIRRTDEGHEDT